MHSSGRVPTVAAQPDLYRFLNRALSGLRLATLALLLLLALAQPVVSLVGVPTWALVLLFAGYDLILSLARTRVNVLRSLGWVALLDLPMAGLLYWLAAEPGGPFFILFFLAVDSAAASLRMRPTLLYTGCAAAIAAVIELLLRERPPTVGDFRDLGVRLITLVLVAVGMAIVTRRLAMEQAQADLGRDEAERLAALERLRTEFISSVSHDLRTPVTAARAGLGLLERSVLSRLRSDEQSLLTNIRRNIERLNLLIDDLIASNQLETGTLRLNREPVDLRAIVTSVVAAVQPLIREKGQVLEVDLPEPLPSEGDPRRLEQALLNLVANAYLHTSTGTRISVSGRVTATEVHLVIADTGPGIPPEEQEAIFRRFYRLTSPESGSGLGLTIAQALVQLHGGRIWLTSSSGRGAAFHVELPRSSQPPLRLT